MRKQKRNHDSKTQMKINFRASRRKPMREYQEQKDFADGKGSLQSLPEKCQIMAIPTEIAIQNSFKIARNDSAVPRACGSLQTSRFKDVLTNDL